MHYLLRLERDLKKVPTRPADVSEQPRPAEASGGSSFSSQTQELKGKLQRAKSLAEEKTRVAVDLENRLAEGAEARLSLEAQLEEHKKAVADLERDLEEARNKLLVAEELAEERATERDDERQASGERIKILEIEVGRAQDWARASEAKLVDIGFTLESRDAESRGLREALEAERAESQRLHSALQEAEVDMEIRLTEAGRQAVQSYRASSEFQQDMSEASTDAFTFGFEECLERASRKYPDIDFGEITLEDLISSPRTTRLATPPTPGAGMETTVDETLPIYDPPPTPPMVDPATPPTPGKGVEATADDAPPSSDLGQA